jgi:hypothetical protein
MSKRLSITIVAAVAASAVAVASGVATASSGASAVKPRVVPIVMADPGCHWFRVAGKNQTKLVVTGATSFLNQDEAALIFAGKGLHRLLPVGKTLTIARKGVYHITMVKQAPDDNHLLLVVK